MTQNRRPRRWLINALFAGLVLLAALGFWLALRTQKGPALCARADFGMGVVERLPLDTDHDYYYEVGGYIVHLQVRDGEIAFLDSQCPDHVCEQFGQLSEVYDWAACIPAQAMLTIEPVE